MHTTAKRVLLVVALLAAAAVTSPTRQAAAEPDGGALSCPRLAVEPPTSDFAPGPDPRQTAVVWPDGRGIVIPDRSVAWSPDGARGIFGLSGQPGDVFAVPVVAHWDGSEPTPLDLPAVAPETYPTREATWSPDGQRVAVVQSGSSVSTTTTVFDRWGSALGTLPGTVTAWSPDGAHLAGTGEAGVVVDVTTSPFTAVPVGPAGVVAWSSDGAWLAASGPTSGPGSEATLRVTRPDGTDATVLGTTSVTAAWRPGTSELAWRPGGAAPGDPLLVRDVAAGTDRTVTIPGLGAADPHWSPDGTRLALAAGTAIWVLPGDDDGTLATDIAPEPLPTAEPRTVVRLEWSPDSSRLAYVARRTIDDDGLPVLAHDLGVLDPATGAGPAPVEAARDVPIVDGVWQERIVDVRWAPSGAEVAVPLLAISPHYPWSSSWEEVWTADLAPGARPAGDELRWFPCSGGGVPPTAATPTIPLPPAPAPPSEVRSSLSPDQVHLGWALPWAPLVGMLTHVEIRRDDTDEVVTLPGSPDDADLALGAPGRVVTFSVRAVGIGGASDWAAAPPVQAPRPREVSGTVTSAGQPVGGAQVSLSPAIGRERHVTTTAPDGTWTLGTVPVVSGHVLWVEAPDEGSVSQSIAGIDLAGRASATLDVDLSPTALEPTDVGPAVSLHGTPRSAIRLTDHPPSADELAYAVSTDEEVVVLDDLGRTLLRFADRHGAAALCRSGSRLIVDRSDRVDVLPLYDLSSPVQSIALPRPTTGDVACTDATGAVLLDDGDGTTSIAHLAPNWWPWGPQGWVLEVGPALPTGLERMGGPDVGSPTGIVVFWGSGGVVVDGPDAGIAAPAGPIAGFGSEDHVAVDVFTATALSSSGWQLDLDEGTSERVTQVSADTVEVGPMLGLALFGHELVDLATGDVVRSLPGTVASAFSADGSQLLQVDGTGAHLVPAMPVFADIGFRHPFRTEIEQAFTDGLVTGYPDGTFRPGAPVSRQAAVALLWRAAGSPTGHPDPGFTDVGADHPFRHAIAWAAAEDITTGYPDGTFRGGAPVTRQAWITLLWRSYGEPATDPACTHPGFDDVDAGHPFHAAITWAACAQISDGYPDGTFRPAATATRQAATTTLVRAR